MKKRSDHNVITAEFSLNVVNNPVTIVRKEIFNFRDENACENFKVLTTNTSKLTKCFEDKEEDINKQVKRWSKHLKNMFHQTFSKIRLGKKREK